jgi:protein-S-isoprenylcysteine O-methyltransferase Ste14
MVTSQLPVWKDDIIPLMYRAIAHMMVLTEEEHLLDVYDEEYERYCERVPRYLGFPLNS